MRGVLVFLLLAIIAIPVFAVFQLLRRLDQNKVDEGAKERFYEALCEQYGRPSVLSAEPEAEKPKRALTEEERIKLAKRLSEDPFSDVTADDIRSESPQEESYDSDNDTVSGNSETGPENRSEKTAEAVSEETGTKKMSREEALAMVSNMLGSSNKKTKGSAYNELQETLNKYRKK